MSTPSQPVPRRLRHWLIPLYGMALVVLAAVAVVVAHDVRARNRAERYHGERVPYPVPPASGPSPPAERAVR